MHEDTLFLSFLPKDEAWSWHWREARNTTHVGTPQMLESWHLVENPKLFPYLCLHEPPQLTQLITHHKAIGTTIFSANCTNHWGIGIRADLCTHSHLAQSLPALPCRNGDDCRGKTPQHSLQNVSQCFWNCDARQRGAPIKGIVSNVSHRLTQGDACQRGAALKDTIPNLSHRLTQGDAHQRGAAWKGIVPNVSHTFTQGDARQRAAV